MAGEKERGRENYFEGVREKRNYYENCFHRFIFSLDDRWREMKNEISTSLEGENIGLRNEHGEAEERERQRREREREVWSQVLGKFHDRRSFLPDLATHLISKSNPDDL